MAFLIAYVCNKTIAFTIMPYRNAFDVMVKPFFVVFSFVIHIPRKLSKLFVMSKVMNTIVTVFY